MDAIAGRIIAFLNSLFRLRKTYNDEESWTEAWAWEKGWRASCVWSKPITDNPYKNFEMNEAYHAGHWTGKEERTYNQITKTTDE